MAQPGWYPDPQDPNRPRYWDGQAWGAAGQLPGGAPNNAASRSKTPLWIGLGVMVAVIAVVAALALTGNLPGGTIAAPDNTQTARPTGSVWDETLPSESPTPSDPPPSDDVGELVECPRVSNVRASANSASRVYGADLSFEPPRTGWDVSDRTWANTLADQGVAERNHPGTTWYNVLVVGLAPSEHGFTDPRITARQVMDCHLSSISYPGLTGKTLVVDEAVEIDGHPGWRVRVEAGSTDAPGGGSAAEYVVVDTGNPEGLSVFWGGAVNADQQAMADVQEVRETLRVER